MSTADASLEILRAQVADFIRAHQPRQAITCEVIAAYCDLSDIEGVDVQDRLLSLDHTEESHADLSSMQVIAAKIDGHRRETYS